MALNGQTEKRMVGRTDRRTAEHGPNYIPPLWRRIISNAVMYWSTHNRKTQEVESSIFWPTVAVYALFGPVP